MSSNQNNLLIDHLDNVLDSSEVQALEELLRNNPAMSAEWELLQYTVANIREAGLNEQITAVRSQYSTGKSHLKQPAKRAVVRTMSQKMMRVAAVLLLVSLSVASYKYMFVNSTGIYNEYYSVYELNTSRSVNEVEILDNAYREKRWDDVIRIVDGVQNKTNKHYFLAGIAHLELKQFTEAVQSFETVRSRNKNLDDDFFGEESDYYLGMSYLASNQPDKAMSLLEQIKLNKNHLFHSVVDKMGLDFHILRLKEGK